MNAKTAVKCLKCGKKTNMVCHRCQEPICAQHAFHIKHHLYCPDCFLRERKVGMLKAWSMIMGMLIVAIVVIFLLQ